MTLKQAILGLALLPTSIYAADSDDLIYIKLYDHQLKGNSRDYKLVALPRVHPNSNLIHQLKYRASQANSSRNFSQDLPTKVDLGMNKVPVLDQGPFGTCVTFSTLAALDALKGKGDYYSQLCSLNLGKYLKQNGYGDSGWSGLNLFTLTNRIDDYGLISVKNQKMYGCGGGKHYPLRYTDNTNPMSLEEYHKYSEELPSKAYTPFYHYFEADQFHKPKMDLILERSRAILNSGKRILIGIYMPSDGSYGLDGRNHQLGDTWVLTDKLQKRLQDDDTFWNQIAGHAMVLVGYDDQAKAIDNTGKEHIGLLKVRNSWSSNYGDRGDFYISYDYFKSMVGELVAVQ